MLWVSIPAGLYGAKLAHEVKEWRKKWKNGTYDAPVASVPVDPVVELSSQLGAVPVGEALDNALEAMTKYCQARINQIGTNPAARKHLIAFWPDGLPSPKKGISTDAQLITLLNYLDSVEKQFDVPFIPDPRAAMQKGKHRSEVDRTNQFLLDVS